MIRTVSIVLLLLAGFAGRAAIAQEVEDLVSVDSANRSATVETTWTIARYIAQSDDATLVQVLAQPRPDLARTMGLPELLEAIRTDAVLTSGMPEPSTAPPTTTTTRSTTPPSRTTPPRRTTPSRNPFGGDGGGGGGGGGGGWGG